MLRLKDYKSTDEEVNDVSLSLNIDGFEYSKSSFNLKKERDPTDIIISICSN